MEIAHCYQAHFMQKFTARLFCRRLIADLGKGPVEFEEQLGEKYNFFLQNYSAQVRRKFGVFHLMCLFWSPLQETDFPFICVFTGF